MRQYHVTIDLIPWYIEAMEKAKKTSKRDVNEIDKTILVNMETKAMLVAKRYFRTNNN